MKVMGIDASTRMTGIALYDGTLLGHWLLNFCSEKEYGTRFGMMMDEIVARIGAGRPDVVYAEDTWEKKGKQDGFNNVATLKKLSYLLGAIRYECHERNIPFNLIYPSEWRRTVGFAVGKLKREELKRLAVDYVAENYGAEVNDDVADAICIAEAGFIINNNFFE